MTTAGIEAAPHYHQLLVKTTGTWYALPTSPAVPILLQSTIEPRRATECLPFTRAKPGTSAWDRTGSTRAASRQDFTTKN